MELANKVTLWWFYGNFGHEGILVFVKPLSVAYSCGGEDDMQRGQWQTYMREGLDVKFSLDRTTHYIIL